MTEVVQTSNVVQVTNRPGYQEQLEALQQRLSVCEKALAEYLETKRLTFPRFYFVSATDLLEIVSKGTQPKQVERTGSVDVGRGSGLGLGLKRFY